MDEKALNARIQDGNKIQVGQPKIYDDTLLRQMLQSAEAKLAALSVLDSTGIAKNFGAISGGSQQISTQAFNVQGPSLPSIETAANGATSSTGTTIAPDGRTDTQTNNQPVQNVKTTQPQTAPPSSTAPAGTLSLPGSPSVSASDILNEQMQLTYEIANLRLLLEGSLTDRFDQSRKIVKERVTLGFPVTLEPDKRFKNAVAVVEVVAETANPALEDASKIEPPIVTALLPREKTYNVAAITEKGTSIGGGVVTQLVGVSAAFLRARKTFYVVQDQDTLALDFNPKIEDKRRKCVGFMWEFKPVLGQKYVKAGLKQTFVQLAFAKPAGTENFGHIYVRTYWRRFDRDTGLVKEVVPDSIVDTAISGNIPSYDLVSNPVNFSLTDLEDLGGGLMRVNVNGEYLSGTRIRIGQAVYSQENNSLLIAQRRMSFLAPIADLATKKIMLVARDGDEQELVMNAASCATQLQAEARIESVDQNNSLVTVTVNDTCFFKNQSVTSGSAKGPEALPPLILVVGGQVYGYSDRPVQRDAEHRKISAVIPTALLIANPELLVESLFKPDRYKTRVDLTRQFGSNSPLGNQYPFSQTDRLVLLGQDKDNTTFLLFGSRLNGLQIIDLRSAQIVHIGGRNEDANTLKKIIVPNTDLKAVKQLILQRPGERPFAVQVPAVDFPANAPPPAATADRVLLHGDEVTINGSGFLDIQSVTYKNVRLPNPIVSSDGKTMRLKGLWAAGVTREASTKVLILNFKDKRVELKLEVVTNIVETRQK